MKKQIKQPKEAHPLSAAERRLYAAAIAASRKTNAVLLLARETLLDYMENQLANHTVNGTCVKPTQMNKSLAKCWAPLAKCWAREQAAWHAAEHPSKRQ